MKKKLFLVVVFLLFAGVGAGYFGLGPAVKSGIETQATAALETPTTLESVSLSLFGGSASLKNFKVGNAEGFKEPHSIIANDISCSLQLSSLLSDIVEIEEISIVRPTITLEVSLGGSNLGKLLQVLEKKKEASSTAEPTEEAPPSAAQGESKRLRIGVVRIETPSVILAQSAFGADRREYSTQTIELRNLGDASGTTDMEGLLQQILSAVLEEVAKKNKIPSAVMDVLNKDLPVLKEVLGGVEKVGGEIKEGLDKIFGR